MLSQVNRAFNTSMEVGVSVLAEGLISGVKRSVCSAFFVFVALGPDGKKKQVPPMQPDSVKNDVSALNRAMLVGIAAIHAVGKGR